MISESFLKRVLMFIGFILSGLITLIFISTPESLQVPVPDSVPSITTKSSLNRELEEAKQYFGSSIKAQIPGASLASVVSWSPNSKYILANVRFIDPSGPRVKPFVLDITRKQYVEVPSATLLDTVSWSGNKIAYATETGFGYFDIVTNQSKVLTTAGETQPIISSDGSYIAYNNNGLAVYSVKTNKVTQLSQNKNDVPLLWKADDKTLIISTGENKKPTLAEFHIGTRAQVALTQLPESLAQAVWVSKDELVLLTLSVGDSYFDYAYDFSDAALTLLAETTEGTAFVAHRDREIGIVKGSRITTYDNHVEKKTEVKRTEKNRIAHFSLLPSPLAMFVREQDGGYEVAAFNLQTSIETVVDTIWLPYTIVSPNGRTAVTVSEGSDAVQFVELPNA